MTQQKIWKQCESTQCEKNLRTSGSSLPLDHAEISFTTLQHCITQTHFNTQHEKITTTSSKNQQQQFATGSNHQEVSCTNLQHYSRLPLDHREISSTNLKHCITQPHFNTLIGFLRPSMKSEIRAWQGLFRGITPYWTFIFDGGRFDGVGRAPTIQNMKERKEEKKSSNLPSCQDNLKAPSGRGLPQWRGGDSTNCRFLEALLPPQSVWIHSPGR